MIRNHLAAPIEAEQFTRELHTAFLGDHEGFDRALAIAREKMDCGVRRPQVVCQDHVARTGPGSGPAGAVGAQAGYAAALAPLSRRELGELVRSLYPVLCGQNHEGHTLVDRYTGRRMCDLLEKMDRRGLFDAADALAPLVDPELSQATGGPAG